MYESELPGVAIIDFVVFSEGEMADSISGSLDEAIQRYVDSSSPQEQVEDALKRVLQVLSTQPPKVDILGIVLKLEPSHNDSQDGIRRRQAVALVAECLHGVFAILD